VFLLFIHFEYPFRPSLLALAKNTQSTIEGIGWIFIARSIGYLIGSIIGGPAFDRWNGSRLVAFAMCFTVIGEVCIPLMRNLWGLACIVSMIGVSMGFFDTGGNVSIIWLYGSEAGPYLQAVHFCFGLGAFLVPMMINKVMRSSPNNNNNNNILWAYLMMAMITAPLIVWPLFYRSPKEYDKERKRKQQEEEAEQIRRETELEVIGAHSTKIFGPREKTIIMLTALFMMFYVGAEVATGGFLYAFAFLRGLEEESGSAYLTSMFWGMFTLGRLIAIPVSMRVSAKRMLLGNLFGCIGITLFWLMFVESRWFLWVSVAVYGWSMSSTFPSALQLAESYVDLSGQRTTVIVVGAAAGEMIVPFMVATLMSSLGTISLVWVLFLSSVSGLVCYVMLVWIGTSTSKQIPLQTPSKASLPNRHEEDIQSAHSPSLLLAERKQYSSNAAQQHVLSGLLTNTTEESIDL